MIKFFKDSDTMALRTDCPNETQTTIQFCTALADMIESGQYDGNWRYVLMGWIPSLVEIILAQRGYKAKVDKRTLLTAGDRMMSEEQVVFIHQPISETKAEIVITNNKDTHVANG